VIFSHIAQITAFVFYSIEAIICPSDLMCVRKWGLIWCVTLFFVWAALATCCRVGS